MSVIWAHRDGNFAALHEVEDFGNDGNHIRVAVEVIGFVEIAFAIAFCIAKVKEMDVVAKSLHHARQIVVGTHTV
jgi:hypothetical protein